MEDQSILVTSHFRILSLYSLQTKNSSSKNTQMLCSSSTLKTVEEIVRDLNADGISEDPVVHVDDKGSDGVNMIP